MLAIAIGISSHDSCVVRVDAVSPSATLGEKSENCNDFTGQNGYPTAAIER